MSGLVERPETTVAGEGCPTQAFARQGCSTDGLICSYTTGDCRLTYVCHANKLDPDKGVACGATPLGWFEVESTICGGCAGNTSCVPCNVASQGDPCDASDYSCVDNHGGGNCGGVVMCNAEHKWVFTLAPCCEI